MTLYSTKLPPLHVIIPPEQCAVDTLTLDPSGATPAMVWGMLAMTPAAIIMGYTLTRIGASFCNEARNAVFSSV